MFFFNKKHLTKMIEVKNFIGLASDHAAFPLKQFVKKYLDENLLPSHIRSIIGDNMDIIFRINSTAFTVSLVARKSCVDKNQIAGIMNSTAIAKRFICIKIGIINGQSICIINCTAVFP